MEAAGAGRIVLTRVKEALAGYAGRLTGVYPKVQPGATTANEKPRRGYRSRVAASWMLMA